MKRLLLTFVLLIFALPLVAATRITATITVTNTSGTINGDTITVNGNVRTWTNNVVTSSSQILTNNTAGGSATNLWNQIIANPYTGPILPSWSSTNIIRLNGAIDQAMSVTFGGTWATVTYTTQTVQSATVVRVPITVEAATIQTNIATLLISNVFNLGLSTEKILESSTAMDNFASLTEAQTLGSKTLTNSTFNGGTLTNATIKQLLAQWATNGVGIYFHNGSAVVSNVIQPDAVGVPSIYSVASLSAITTNNPLSFMPAAENIITRASGENWYGVKSKDNTFTALNTFTKITNSTLVNSTLDYNTYSGNVTYLTNGMMSGTGLTNSALTNVTFYQTNVSVGAWDWQRVNNTSLANGNNAGVDFGTAVFVNIKAGPTASFTLNGISGVRNGRWLILVNQTGQAMTIANESGVEPTAANRIRTLTGTDVSASGSSSWGLLYDTDSSRWVVAWMPRATGAGSGNVTGPGSSTDNAVARFDGTGGATIQNSGVIVDDSNNVTGVAALSATSGTFSGLTSGRVTFAGASGLLSGNANFEWNNTAGAEQLRIRGDAIGALDLIKLSNLNTNTFSGSDAAGIVAHLAAEDDSTSRFAGGIRIKKVATWTSTASTRDSRLEINLVEDGVEDAAARFEVIGGIGSLKLGFSSTPGAQLDLDPGTTSWAPIKISLGSLLTTPAAGAFAEYDGNDYYATITGNVRSKIGRVLTGTATLNFDLTAVASQDLTITVTGAADGDTVAVGVPNGSVTADTLFWGWVSAADTVTVRAMRIAGTPNPASGTFKATVIKN